MAKRESRICCGTSEVPAELYVGKTVASIRNGLRTTLNIPPGAKCHINGKPSNNSHVLAKGENLEFIKPTGRHG